MNKRIEELAKQCTTIYDSTTIPVEKDFDYEKFAELIIWECMKQCEKVRDEADVQKKSEYLTDVGRTLYEGIYGGANNCGFFIQQHFGV